MGGNSWFSGRFSFISLILEPLGMEGAFGKLGWNSVKSVVEVAYEGRLTLIIN